MTCPLCHARQTKCHDSRALAWGGVRRRRWCECGHRFTTYEVVWNGSTRNNLRTAVELVDPRVLVALNATLGTLREQLEAVGLKV